MSSTSKSSGAGKGSHPRPMTVTKSVYDENYENISWEPEVSGSGKQEINASE